MIQSEEIKTSKEISSILLTVWYVMVQPIFLRTSYEHLILLFFQNPKSGQDQDILLFYHEELIIPSGCAMWKPDTVTELLVSLLLNCLCYTCLIVCIECISLLP